MTKSPISILQEYVVQNRLSIPSYEFTGDGLSHQPVFTCLAKLGNHSVTANGLTKKEAKHNAAIKLLEVFNIFLDKSEQVSNICLLPSTNKSKINNSPLINYVGKLNEFCASNKLAQPMYTDGDAIYNQFNIVCNLQNFKEEGVGSTKKEAKQDAARKMLALIKYENLNDIPNTLSQGIKYEAPNIDEAIEKYSVIMNNIRISYKENGEENEFSDIDMKATVNGITSWADLIEFFNIKGWSYKLTCFQSAPLIMKLIINDYLLLKSGDCQKDIEKCFVSDVVRMLNEGVDFGIPLIKV